MLEERTLKALYCNRRHSMTEIGQQLGVTHATVLYWLKKYGIARRSWSESAYVKLNPDGDPFTIPRVLSSQQRELTAAALLLYWAEGAKTLSSTRLVNLDVRMLQLFLRFLREVCQAREERLRVSVRVHKRFPLPTAKAYWGRKLCLAPSRIFVYRHTDRRSASSAQWSRYGLATLEFPSTRFKTWLDQAIDGYVGYLVNSQNGYRLPRAIRNQGAGLVADGLSGELLSTSTDKDALYLKVPQWVMRENLSN